LGSRRQVLILRRRQCHSRAGRRVDRGTGEAWGDAHVGRSGPRTDSDTAPELRSGRPL